MKKVLSYLVPLLFVAFTVLTVPNLTNAASPVASCSGSPTTVAVGQSVKWIADYSGGMNYDGSSDSNPYFIWSGTDLVATGTNQNSITVKYSTIGEKKANITYSTFGRDSVFPYNIIGLSVGGPCTNVVNVVNATSTPSTVPTISGLTAPIALSVGQVGTWTVRASDKSNGSLSYSVKWGDEGKIGLAGSEPFVQTSTFTHTYSVAGTYKPTFTVKNEAGLSAETSATVQVGSSTNCYVFTTNLTIGSTGADVVALQDLLIAKGFGIVKIQTGETPKGYFGEDTKNAVMLYQKSIGIDSTGFVGPLTRASLNAGLCNTSDKVIVSNTSATLGTPILRENNTVGYSFTLAFTVNNSKDEPIYIASMPSELVRLSTVNSPSAMNLSNMIVTPNTLSGDAEKVFVIPAGASRTVAINGILRNDTGTPGLKDVRVTGISYFNFGKNPDSGVVEKGLEGLRLKVNLDGNTTMPTLSVLSPVGERTYKFGSTIQIAWDARNVDADYYYALLENTAIQNLGVVVTKYLPVSTSSASFVFNKNVLNAFVSNGGGLTEEQLWNRYYVRVVGMKKGILADRPVVNNVSGIFGISNSVDVTVSDAVAKLGPGTGSGNVPTIYPATFSFKLTNNRDNTIYIPSNPASLIEVNIANGLNMFSLGDSLSMIPSELSGDSERFFVIPAGTSRKVTINSILNNSNGTPGLKSVKIMGIAFLDSLNSQGNTMIESGLSNLKIDVVMGGITENNNLIIRNTAARLGPAILKGNDVYGYNYDMSLTVANPGKFDVYMDSKENGNDLTAVISPDVASVKYVKSWSPLNLAGDTSNAVVIPSGASRTMKITGQIINMGKPTLVNYRVTGLNYGTTTGNTKVMSITSGLENLKISANFGGGSTNKPSITVLSPTGGTYKVGNSMQILWNTSNIPSNQDIDISLMLDAVGIGKTIASVKNTGSYTWKVDDIEAFYDSESSRMIYPNGNYKIDVVCAGDNDVCNSMTSNFGQSAMFSIATSTVPTQTPSYTPVPSVNATLSASLLSTNTDKAGTWFVFAPGRGAGGAGGTTDSADWNWSANLNLTAEKKISSVTIRQTNGEYWSTDNATYFPLVVADSSGKQLNSQYSNSLGSFRSGQYKWMFYGQKNTSAWVGGYMTIVFSDGTKVSANIIALPYATPTPTPYVTPTATPTPYGTPTPTPYVTPTPTLYATPTPTPYVTPTPTPYATPTPTPYATPTPTPYATPTPTPYVTPTPTPYPSPSSSPRPSSSPSAMIVDDARLQASIWQAIADWFMVR